MGVARDACEYFLRDTFLSAPFNERLRCPALSSIWAASPVDCEPVRCRGPSEFAVERLDEGIVSRLARSGDERVVSRIFRTFNLAERHPALGHAVMAPLICWSFSNSMFRYLLVDHAVPAMWRSLAAARLSAD